MLVVSPLGQSVSTCSMLGQLVTSGILTFCQLYATLRETILYHEQTKHENKNKELSGKKAGAWTISQKMTRPITKRAEQN